MIIKDTFSRILETKDPNLRDSTSKNQKFLQIYKIQMSDIRPKALEDLNERQIYLNLNFGDSQKYSIQTQCIDIFHNVNHFQIETINDLTKIQVIQYDSMKKLAKISLKGVQKQFQYSFQQKTSKISILLQRKILKPLNDSKHIVSEKQNQFEQTVEYYKLSHSTNESFQQAKF